MRKYKKIIISVLGVGILVGGALNINALAESKAHLADLVMEHEAKITSLEQQIKDLQSKPSSNPLTDNVKQALLKELFKGEYTFEDPNSGKKMNITDVDIVVKNGDIVIQTFTEGDYNNWAEVPDKNSYASLGRFFAEGFIAHSEYLTKLYGLHDVIYEFYQNGERVKVSTSL